MDPFGVDSYWASVSRPGVMGWKGRNERDSIWWQSPSIVDSAKRNDREDRRSQQEPHDLDPLEILREEDVVSKIQDLEVTDLGQDAELLQNLCASYMHTGALWTYDESFS